MDISGNQSLMIIGEMPESPCVEPQHTPMNMMKSDAERRFDAWWQGGLLDRPPVRFQLEKQRDVGRPPAAATLRDRWMNPDIAVPNGLASLAETDWLGDSVPIYMPNLGPDITGTFFGCELEFGEDTSWSTHPLESEEDYEKLAQSAPDFSNPYWLAIEEMTRRSLAAGNDHLTGITDLHGSADTLVSLRGPEAVCYDFLDFPELVHRALAVLADSNREIFRRSYSLLRQGGQEITTTWTAFLHRGPAYVSSADILALLSPEMALEFVRPYLRREWADLERSIFHLDGPAALRHLDWLLEEEWIQAIQWVYGAGGGRAADWIEVYRKIRKAGRAIQLLAVDTNDALEVLREIGPEGVWIEINGSRIPTPKEAESFLSQIDHLCGSHP